jgi:hypothetical protein
MTPTKIEPQVPPERPYMTNLRTPLPLHRNIVNKNVLLIVLLYCYSSTLPGYAKNLGNTSKSNSWVYRVNSSALISFKILS